MHITTLILALSLSYIPHTDALVLSAGSPVPIDAATAPDVAVPASAGLTCLSGPADHIDACAQVVLDAIVNHQWGLLASFAVLLLVAALRKWTPEASKLGVWFRSKLGAIITSFTLSLAGAFGVQFLAGAPFSFALVVKALTVAITASGGWAIFKNVREAIDESKSKQAGAAAAADPKSTLDA